jgi:hypothetical protein
MFNTLAPTLRAMLTDENARSVVAAHLEAESYKLKERAQQEASQNKETQRNNFVLPHKAEKSCDPFHASLLLIVS